MKACACNPSVKEVEAEGSEVEGHPLLYVSVKNKLFSEKASPARARILQTSPSCEPLCTRLFAQALDARHS